MRQVVTGIPGKTGVVYTLDRATGEFLWATPDHHPERDRRDRRGDRRRDRERRARLHGRGAGSAGLPARQRRQGLGGGRLQPPHQHDVLPAAQRLRPDAGDDRGRGLGGGLRAGLAGRDRARHRPGRQHLRDLGRDRGYHLATRSAGGHHVPRRHGRRAGLGRGRQRAFPRLRRRDGGDPLGDQPRVVGVGLPDHLRRRRPAVRRGEHRHAAIPRPDAGAAPEHQQQPVRVRVGLEAQCFDAGPGGTGRQVRAGSARAPGRAPSQPLRAPRGSV